MVQITLEAARVNAGLSQKEAAKKLGISNATLVNWEKYRTFPSAEHIVKICEVYGMSYDNIIFLSKNSL